MKTQTLPRRKRGDHAEWLEALNGPDKIGVKLTKERIRIVDIPSPSEPECRLLSVRK
ncbi:uncharacterized protein PHALS_14341 [Plasmopara halstedii]|uniref:Uncharacterized protein n=1 Tax=Plasmopara halstedii TaxID=4781 RepID=A0A0P1ARS9_PLAHL|nr:uncharacterized protein PHALS_14341 [Plasmopara halstedii]CEG44073.1 hypothetical protein PHALS_14341 [Plasmopara halstedii]|eukprot:XP_024580442.1 hypothetical protein PHALS_14341 [Plasmopara halstedii]